MFFYIPNSICMFLFSPYPIQYLLFVYIFLMIATLTDLKWYFIVFICISLISKDMENLFMWLYVIFGKMSMQFFCPFSDWVVCFLILSCMCVLYELIYILEILTPFQSSFTNIFSCSEGCLFIFSVVSFSVPKL